MMKNIKNNSGVIKSTNHFDPCKQFVFSNIILSKYLIYIELIWMNDDHYSDVMMGALASQITSLTIVYSTVCSDADQ